MITKLKLFLIYSIPELWKHPLWRKRSLTPFIRFAKLQLIFFLGAKRVHMHWINDLILPLEKGDTGLTSAYYVGLHEFEDIAFTIHLLRESDIFVDVGANLGSYSLLASGVTKANSIAFEPVPSTYNRLKENIEINCLSQKIITNCIALTKPTNVLDKKQFTFSSDKTCQNSFVDDDYKGSTTKVDVTTLDIACKNINPVLIKIDVEGFEEDLLEGASETLQKQSLLAVIIEGQTDILNQYFYDAGFIDIHYLPFLRHIEPHVLKTSNRLWIKKDKRELIEALLQNAPLNYVYGNKF